MTQQFNQSWMSANRMWGKANRRDSHIRSDAATSLVIPTACLITRDYAIAGWEFRKGAPAMCITVSCGYLNRPDRSRPSDLRFVLLSSA